MRSKALERQPNQAASKLSWLRARSGPGLELLPLGNGAKGIVRFLARVTSDLPQRGINLEDACKNKLRELGHTRIGGQATNLLLNSELQT